MPGCSKYFAEYKSSLDPHTISLPHHIPLLPFSKKTNPDFLCPVCLAEPLWHLFYVCVLLRHQRIVPKSQVHTNHGAQDGKTDFRRLMSAVLNGTANPRRRWIWLRLLDKDFKTTDKWRIRAFSMRRSFFLQQKYSAISEITCLAVDVLPPRQKSTADEGMFVSRASGDHLVHRKLGMSLCEVCDRDTYLATHSLRSCRSWQERRWRYGQKPVILRIIWRASVSV